MKTRFRAPRGHALTCSAAFGLALSLVPALSRAGVDCMVDYGGTRSRQHAEPTTQPYEVLPQDYGSYFQVRIVYRNTPEDLAGIRVYVYGTRGEVPVLIHQGRWPVPGEGRQGARAFTGLQRVYEPQRGTELEYQCDYTPEARP